MAITEFQRGICRLIAQCRVQQGESYVAGGVALNTLLGASRVSRDIDLFHDTREALAATWDADRKALEGNGYGIDVRREPRANRTFQSKRGLDYSQRRQKAPPYESAMLPLDARLYA
jgi:hypothetical protein